MGFNSFFFILIFLPLSIFGYFSLNRIKKYALANVFLICVSLWFIGFVNYIYSLFLCGSILVNYLFVLLLRNVSARSIRKNILVLGTLCNVASLLYFKYYNFFVVSINTAFNTGLLTKEVLLPLGISFYTFQQIAFLVDAFRGRNDKVNFLDYALYVAYFPHAASGPIFMHNDIIEQFKNISKRSLNYQNLSSGLYVFSIGLFKKVIIADTFANAVAWGFSNVEAMSSLDVLIVSLCYTFQLYFDFSGYCDMAIGTSRMFNIELPINFDSPYQATSIVDFWSRWHITLTQFLREYIYFPLGGSKKGKIRTYINIMIIFLISGIWHGANWTFIVWGILHGVFNCLNRIFKKTWERANVVFQWVVTFSIVNLLWLLFRAENLSQAVYLLKKMMCMDSLTVSQGLIDSVIMPEFSFLETNSFASLFAYLVGGIQYFYNRIYGFNIWALLILSFFIVLNLKNTNHINAPLTVWRSLATAIMLVWSMVSFTGVATYIYAGF